MQCFMKSKIWNTCILNTYYGEASNDIKIVRSKQAAIPISLPKTN